MLRVKPVSGALGALLSGVDLRNPLSPQQAAEVREALLQHQVIFLRDQDITPAQFLRFAQAMGTPVEYPFVKGIEGFPEIIEVKKAQGVNPDDFYTVGVVLGRDHVRMPVRVNGQYTLDLRVQLDQPDVVLEDRA